MKPLRKIRRVVIWPLVAVFFVLSGPLGVARAALVETDRVIDHRQVSEDRARIGAFLGRDDVRERLATWGVDPAEAAARVASLSDAEAAEMAAQIDEMPAGQAHSAVVLLLVIVLIILLWPFH